MVAVPGACSVPPCCVAGELGDASAPHSSVWATGGVLQPVCQPNRAPCSCWQPTTRMASIPECPTTSETYTRTDSHAYMQRLAAVTGSARLQLNSFAAAGSARLVWLWQVTRPACTGVLLAGRQQPPQQPWAAARAPTGAVCASFACSMQDTIACSSVAGTTLCSRGWSGAGCVVGTARGWQHTWRWNHFGWWMPTRSGAAHRGTQHVRKETWWSSDILLCWVV